MNTKKMNVENIPSVNTLYNVCAVPWGDIMSTVGGYLEYRGGRGGCVQYREGIS